MKSIIAAFVNSCTKIRTFFSIMIWFNKVFLIFVKQSPKQNTYEKSKL